MRKYHKARSTYAKITNPIDYYIRQGKLKLLKKYAGKYLEYSRKLNPNMKQMINKRLNRLVNERIHGKQKDLLRKLRKRRAYSDHTKNIIMLPFTLTDLVTA